MLKARSYSLSAGEHAFCRNRDPDLSWRLRSGSGAEGQHQWSGAFPILEREKFFRILTVIEKNFPIRLQGKFSPFLGRGEGFPCSRSKEKFFQLFNLGRIKLLLDSVQLFVVSVRLLLDSVRLSAVSVQLLLDSVRLFVVSVQLLLISVQLFVVSVQLRCFGSTFADFGSTSAYFGSTFFVPTRLSLIARVRFNRADLSVYRFRLYLN